MKYLQPYLSLAYCYTQALKLSHILRPIALATFLLGLVWALFIAPSDFQQGEGYRIIYIHVPSAFYAMGIYMAMAAMAFTYLVWRVKIAAIVMRVSSYLGASFAALALITGSIWGKPMWGTWWVWDARLTSALILFFLYLGVIALQNALQNQRSQDKACAVLVLIGTINIPVIHFSVNWWNTLHQGATVTRIWAPTMASSMLRPLFFMLITFGIYSAYILCLRVAAEILQCESNSKWVKKMVQSNA